MVVNFFTIVQFAFGDVMLIGFSCFKLARRGCQAQCPGLSPQQNHRTGGQHPQGPFPHRVAQRLQHPPLRHRLQHPIDHQCPPRQRLHHGFL